MLRLANIAAIAAIAAAAPHPHGRRHWHSRRLRVRSEDAQVLSSADNLQDPSMTVSAYATADSSGAFACTIKPGVFDDAHAVAYYNQTVNSTGWNLLTVSVNPSMVVQAEAGAFAAGCAEAAVSAPEMSAYWANWEANEWGSGGANPDLVQFFAAQLEWVRTQISAFKAANPEPLPLEVLHGTTPQARALRRTQAVREGVFWTGMANLMAQFDGMVWYHANMLPAGTGLDEAHLYYLQAVGDLETLGDIFPAPAAAKLTTSTRAARRQLSRTRAAASGKSFPPMPEQDKLTDCSSLVRVLPDLSDAVVGHTTWRMFYAMLRTWKAYVLPYTRAGIIGYSSSPGLLQSKDDFAFTPQFVIQETTNSVFNTSLYDFVTPQSAFTWQRNAIANAYAIDGEDWTVGLFSLYNSGTYQNQWQVVDKQRFVPGMQPDAGFLWIAEQIPGYIHSADITDIVVADGYWASYNVPYFEDVWTASGYPAMAAQYGPEYTWANCTRALMFKRNVTEGDVSDILTARALLRYNNYAVDPLAKDDPITGSISSRGDLRTPKPVAFGGVDTKVVALSSLGARGDMLALIESGPTHDQQPFFAWANYSAFANVQHYMTPQVFDFPTIGVFLS